MNEPTTVISERDVRQRGLVPPQRLARCDALVIGVGAIGRQVALQLAALGISRMTLFDDDIVQPENLAPQGYWPEDLQQPKVSATADLCRRIHPVIHLTTIAKRFKRSTSRDLAMPTEPIVFCCVDRIVTRHMLWDTLRPSASFFVDGRMSAEVLRVIAVDQPAVDDYYPKTLFAADEAYVGVCTARSTIYTASIAAGMMLHQFAKWLRGMPVDSDLTLDLLAAELTSQG
jgi:molybdopterin/thiamine biosynthesis adenylyltransferase